VREILQNGLDREMECKRTGDEPADMMAQGRLSVKYAAKARTLVIASEDTTIARNTLILGVTKKDGRSVIGQYGEGYKLALAVLLRLGKKVEISNGAERWLPKIIHSARFESDVIAVDVEPGPADNVDLVFALGGIAPAEWREICKKTLRLQDPKYPRYQTSYGQVLTGEGHERQVFVGGLHICTMPERKGWLHGYNFNPGVLSIDRDRRMVCDWEVELNASRMFKETDDVDALVKLIEAQSREVADLYGYGNATETTKNAAKRVFDNFTAKHGITAVPATDSEERGQLEKQYSGAKVVVVGKIVAEACQASVGWKAYIGGFTLRTIKEPVVYLREWAEEHRGDMSPRLFKEFEDGVIRMAQSWKA
ncbi:MAG: hypothetical protein IMZ71_02585, partial [Chloroflexi bacterium]|nr:hypothetical protein [Chloroflexota bacterium]